MSSLPQKFFEELKARSSIVSQVSRRISLSRAGNDLKGCCPFHSEKTPSFVVYEDHYHCFGCGTHGDVVDFVMKLEGKGFMEAVEQLAGEAGMPIPKFEDPVIPINAKRTRIATVLEVAAEIYQGWLLQPEASHARDYLRKRGISETTVLTFGLGWAGEGRGALARALSERGFTAEHLVEAGLMKLGPAGSSDMFQNRIMIPIRDRRGTMLSFGGRALNKNQSKYIIGPDTAAFVRRRSIYGLEAAYNAVRRGEPLVVVGGYFDVLHLHQVGFKGTVAPLGSGLSSDQLSRLWDLSPYPILAFDGCLTGEEALHRTIKKALPMISVERNLRIARLPILDDPSSLVSREGPESFKLTIDAAAPLSEVLYGVLTHRLPARTTSEQSEIRRKISDGISAIQAPFLRQEYRAILMDRYLTDARRKPGGAVQIPALVGG